MRQDTSYSRHCELCKEPFTTSYALTGGHHRQLKRCKPCNRKRPGRRWREEPKILYPERTCQNPACKQAFRKQPAIWYCCYECRYTHTWAITQGLMSDWTPTVRGVKIATAVRVFQKVMK